MGGFKLSANRPEKAGAVRAPKQVTPGWPIKPLIASALVGAMLVMAALVITLGWRGARESMLLSAAASAQDAGKLIVEKSNRMVEPAKTTLRMLSNSALADASVLEERLSYLPVLADVLNGQQLISSVFVGYRDGSFLLVRPILTSALVARLDVPANAAYLVQSVQTRLGMPTDPVAGDQRSGEYLFFDKALKLLQRRSVPEYQFDPRTRPWFEAAGSTARTYTSAPYVFFTTEQVGITLSHANPRLDAVFGVDVVLDDLSAGMKPMRMTPHTELALVDNQGKVVTYTDMQKVLRKTGDAVEFLTVGKIGVPSLEKLHSLGSKTGEVVFFDVDQQQWLGAALPFDAWRANGVRLLVAAPVDDFLAGLIAQRQRLMIGLIALALLLLPLGWLAGAEIGKILDQLTAQAQRMNHFDFEQPPHAAARVREVNNLSNVMGQTSKTIQTFLHISQDMATEPQVERMLDNVLQQMVTATRCAAGAVYLRVDGQTKLRRAAYRGDFIAVSEPHAANVTNLANGEAASLAPLRVLPHITPQLAEMQVDLRGRKGALEGLLVLQYPEDAGHTDPAFNVFVQKLSGMLAVAIETRQLFDAQKKLLDAIIRLVADAIDAKSPYTGGHCERVPVLAGMLVDRMVAQKDGPYAAFSMTEEERYEFHLGAWLHDCGKVTSPEHIIDKSTKLEAIYNRLHEVRMRFEVLWRDADIAYWQAVAKDGGANVQASSVDALDATRRARQQALVDDFAFVAACNVGGESMSDADVERLHQLAATTWTRHFDNRIGLCGDENQRVAQVPQAALPIEENLLANLPHHVLPWGDRRPAVQKDDAENAYGFDMHLPQVMQNLGELHNLGVRRGTLTEEDRFRINDHIVQTLVMLRTLPWPAHLAQVPDIASTHHEKLDGTGYPRRLVGDQLTLPARVMALADIFEALTAADRPYKTPKTLTESLQIMAKMAGDQHIDAELFRYFLQSNLWQEFARRFMRPEQIDSVNVAAIDRLLPRAQSAQTAQFA